jgi:hypothetical protein
MNSGNEHEIAELVQLQAVATKRFFRWAIEQCATEVQFGFAHVKTIRGAWVLGMVEFIERLPVDDRVSVMQAKVASGDPDARLSERQTQLLQVVRRAPSVGFGPRYMQMLEDYAAGRYRVPRPVLRRALKRDLTAVLGRSEQADGSAWKHRTEVGKWTVLTEVDTGGSARQFEVGHLVKLGESNLFWASPARWWGLGMPTVWDRVAADDLDGATDAAAALCRYFVEQLPGMLDGL